jgi:hypothetical protein
MKIINLALCVNCREAGRVVLIPFPAVKHPHSEEERFDHQQRLERVMKKNSSSIGRLIATGMTLKTAEGKLHYKNVIVPFVRSCLQGAKRRILCNYSILLYFAFQVSRSMHVAYKLMVLCLEDYEFLIHLCMPQIITSNSVITFRYIMPCWVSHA